MYNFPIYHHAGKVVTYTK